MERRTLHTPLGRITLQGEENALTHLWLPGQWMGEETGSTPLLLLAETQLKEYFKGELHQFSLPVAPQGTPFQQKVWGALSTIPYGATWSYKQLAHQVDCAGGARAVGNANGKNPLPILIPCHRVITSQGSLGGYSGGIAIKMALLHLEQGENSPKN